jgi:hypothetical protein
MSQSALRAPAADHLHSAEEVCPYCDQAIPNERAEEIRTRFEEARKRNEAAFAAEMDQRLAAKSAELEAAKKTEIEQMQAANTQALRKVQEVATAQQAAAREEGKKIASEEARQTIAKMTAAQEASTLRLQGLQEAKATADAQIQSLKDEREATIAARTTEIRTAMENSKAAEINALAAKHAEEAAKLSAQIGALQKRIDSEAGEGADINLFEELKAAFPEDDISKIAKSAGADIVHIVKHNKQVCGKILYDSRNRNLWRTEYAATLQKDMITEKADHAILTTNKFPAGVKQLCIAEGVVVANLARVAVLVEILREEIISHHSQNGSAQDREQKAANLYSYIASDAFAKFLKSLDGNDEKLLALEEEERAAHTKMWEKRGRMLKETQRLHGNLRTGIDRIIGTSSQD